MTLLHLLSKRSLKKLWKNNRSVSHALTHHPPEGSSCSAISGRVASSCSPSFNVGCPTPRATGSPSLPQLAMPSSSAESCRHRGQHRGTGIAGHQGPERPGGTGESGQPPAAAQPGSAPSVGVSRAAAQAGVLFHRAGAVQVAMLAQVGHEHGSQQGNSAHGRHVVIEV